MLDRRSKIAVMNGEEVRAQPDAGGVEGLMALGWSVRINHPKNIKISLKIPRTSKNFRKIPRTSRPFFRNFKTIKTSL